MRNKIVAGNWKMNNDLDATKALLGQLANETLPEDVTLLVAPSYPFLSLAVHELVGSDIMVAAQNMSYSDQGAFTGEVSWDMLKSIGVNWVILGHSERRSHFSETGEDLYRKVSIALNNGLKVIFCFGEELADRKAGRHEEVVKKQLEEVIFKEQWENAWKSIVLAYEPVWAIGTGETATPEQAQEMHQFVRWTLKNRYSEEIADNVSILYGGSVKPANAAEIFGQPDVDGGLIGGASLDAASFMAIAGSF